MREGTIFIIMREGTIFIIMREGTIFERERERENNAGRYNIDNKRKRGMLRYNIDNNAVSISCTHYTQQSTTKKVQYHIKYKI